MESCFWYDGVMKYIQVWLSCVDKVEADKIAKVLLEKRLIACAKQILVSSDFRWKGKIEHGEEVLLILDSREDLFADIESEVSKLHSYETFVLQSLPLSNISKDALKWLEGELT